MVVIDGVELKVDPFNCPLNETEEEERERLTELIKMWNHRYKGTKKEYKGTVDELIKTIHDRIKNTSLE